MKKIIYIKKALCFATISLLTVFAVACSKDENIASNEDFLRSSANYSYMNFDCSKSIEKMMPENLENIDTNQYPFVISKNDTTTFIYSLLDNDYLVDSYTTAEASHSYIETESLEYGYNSGTSDIYLCIEFVDGDKKLFDKYGTLLLDKGKYQNLNIILDRDAVLGEEVGLFRFEGTSSTLFEQISYVNADGEKVIINNKISVTTDNNNLLYYPKYEREAADDSFSFVSSYKLGGTYKGTTCGDASIFGLEGYTYSYSNGIVNFFDSNNKIVTSFDTEANTTFHFANGYIFKQVLLEAANDQDDFDVYISGQKYDVYTSCVNIKNGKEKEIKNFDYIIFNESIRPMISVDENNNSYFTCLYASVREIEDKRLGSRYLSVYFEGNGKVLNENNLYDITSVFKLSDNRYLGFSELITEESPIKIPWLLNEKGEKIMKLTEDGSICTYGQIISIRDNKGLYHFANFDGKIIDNKTYESVTQLYSGKFFVEENGKNKILTFEKGQIVKTYNTNERIDTSNGVSVYGQDGYCIYDKDVLIESVYNEETELSLLNIMNLDGEAFLSIPDVSEFRVFAGEIGPFGGRNKEIIYIKVTFLDSLSNIYVLK